MYVCMFVCMYISYRNAASEIYSELIDIEGYEVRVSLYFVKWKWLLVLSCYACMHALSLNSKFLMTTHKKYFPCFIATQIDKSSPPVVKNTSSADCEKHRNAWKVLSVNLIIILRVNEIGVSVKFLQWKKSLST